MGIVFIVLIIAIAICLLQGVVDTFPLVQDQRVVAVGTETTTGTAATVTAAQAAFNAYFVSDGIEELTNVTMRQGEGSSSMLPAVPNSYWGRFEFEVDAVGAGASGVPAYMTVLLGACGYNVSGGTYTPITGETQADTITIGYYVDGHLSKLIGAMGNVTLALRAGEPARWRFEFFGRVDAESDVALITPTFPTVVPPLWQNSTNTYDSYALRSSVATFNLGNVIVPRLDPNSAGGIRSAVIVHREPTLETDPEAVLVATKDFQTYFRAGTAAALVITLGTAANNTITLNAAKAQVIAYPMVNRDGIMARNLRLLFTRNASTYDSEHTIVYS